MSRINHTPQGEITFDTDTNEYTVWDETYAYVVCITPYPQIAEGAYKIYCKYYLEI